MYTGKQEVESKKKTASCKATLHKIGMAYIQSNDPSILKNKKCPETGKPYYFRKDWFEKDGKLLTCFEHKKDSSGKDVGIYVEKDGSVK
ncbi:MAG: hypothetical protein MK132_01415 [Lentisphaerales bacterium]|nr:hypothetical protein [Lentisphaerales bacterium]